MVVVIGDGGSGGVRGRAGSYGGCLVGWWWF